MAIGPHQTKVLKRKRQDAAIEKDEHLRRKLKTTNGPAKRVVSPIERAHANGYLEEVCRVRGIPYKSIRESMPTIAAHFGIKLEEISGPGSRSKAAIALARAIHEKVGAIPSLATPRKPPLSERVAQAEKQWRKTLSPEDRAKLNGQPKPQPLPAEAIAKRERIQFRAARKKARKAKAAAKQEAAIKNAQGNRVALRAAAGAALEQMLRVSPPDDAFTAAAELLKGELAHG